MGCGDLSKNLSNFSLCYCGGTFENNKYDTCYCIKCKRIMSKEEYKTRQEFSQTEIKLKQKNLELDQRERLISKREYELELKLSSIDVSSIKSEISLIISKIEEKGLQLKNNKENSNVNLQILENEIIQINNRISKQSKDNNTKTNELESENGIKNLQNYVSELIFKSEEKNLMQKIINDSENELLEIKRSKEHFRKWLSEDYFESGANSDSLLNNKYWLFNHKVVNIRSPIIQKNLRAYPQKSVDLTTNNMSWEKWLPIKVEEELNTFYFQSMFHGTYLSSDLNGKVFLVGSYNDDSEKWKYEADGRIISKLSNKILTSKNDKVLLTDSSEKWVIFPIN